MRPAVRVGPMLGIGAVHLSLCFSTSSSSSPPSSVLYITLLLLQEDFSTVSDFLSPRIFSSPFSLPLNMPKNKSRNFLDTLWKEVVVDRTIDLSKDTELSHQELRLKKCVLLTAGYR